MALPIPFKMLMERGIRRVVVAGSSLEPQFRLDALKLGVDWQKTINKDADASERGAFFYLPVDGNDE